MTTSIRSPSRLLEYLPVIYRDDPFIGQFLLAFEQLLLGFEDAAPLPDGSNPPGLEAQIANVATYFDPLQNPPDFLPWLASWTALTLRADLPLPVQRKFVANIIRYYRFRGTKANLQALLKLFLVAQPTVEEPLEGGTPHFFKVTVVLPEAFRDNQPKQARQLLIASAIIELEKPAHTYYELNPIFPNTIQVGVISKVGVDTVLGSIPAPPK